MPESQPTPAIQAIEDPLLRAYARAWERVLAIQQQIANDPARWRQARKLREAQGAIERIMDRLDAQAAAWVEEDFPGVYGMGVNAGAAELGSPAGAVWSMIQQEAVEELAQSTFEELLKSTKGVRRSAKKLIREVARDEALQKLIQGDTATAAGRRMAEILAQNGLHAVRYADGSRHGLKEYSHMVVRTKTATAYNHGVLNAQESQGIAYWEVFDGAFCGWFEHGRGPSANGRIVSKDEAMQYPISHPNCRRAFGARPDVTTRKQAKELMSSKKSASTTEAQRAGQADIDRQRAAQSRQRSRMARRKAQQEQAKPKPQLPSQEPRTGRAASGDARRESRAAARGDLDLNPPIQATDDVILDDFLANPYKDVPSVEKLVEQGFDPEAAVKEHKRLKANAASKASKLKAKLKAATDELMDEDLRRAGTGQNPALIHSENPKGRGYVQASVGKGNWFDAMSVDTPNYVPVRNLVHEGVTIQSGIVTRRNGVSYLMETQPGEVVTQAVKDQFEKDIAKSQAVLSSLPDPGAAKYQKGVAFLRQNNPHDAHWAEAYGIPNFKSAATGGNGGTTFWNTQTTYGTLRHEFGHNLDNAHPLSGDLGSGSKAWADAVEKDKAHSGAHHPGAQETYAGGHPMQVGQDGVTTYGDASKAEDFAESVRLYLKDRYDGKLAVSADGTELRFKDVYPERAKVLDQMFLQPPDNSVTPWLAGQIEKAKAATAEAFISVGDADVFVTGAKLQELGVPTAHATKVHQFAEEALKKHLESKNIVDLAQKDEWVDFLHKGLVKADQLEALADEGSMTAKTALEEWAGLAKKEKAAELTPKGTPVDWETHGFSEKAVQDFHSTLAAVDPADGLDGIHDAVEMWAYDWFGNDGLELAPEMYDHLTGPSPKIYGKAAEAAAPGTASVANVGLTAAGEPDWTVMKKDLPKNVQASIASKKSKFKKDITSGGLYGSKLSDAEIAEKVAALEQDEVIKRWRQLNAGKSQTQASLPPLVPGERGAMRPQLDQARKQEAAAFLREAGTRKSPKGLTGAGGAKDTLIDQITDRLWNDEGWAQYRAKVEDRIKVLPDQAKVHQLYDELHHFISQDALTSGQVQNVADRLGISSFDSQARIKDMFTAMKKGAGRDDFDRALLPSKIEWLAKPDATKAHVYNEVSSRVQTWASNSGDSNTESILMQLAAKEQFGLTGDPWVAFRSGGSSRAAIEDMYRDQGGWYRAVAQAMYENTQAEFRAAGITEISVVRGMSFGHPPPTWATVAGASRPELMPINSWSTDVGIAKRFASGAAGNGSGSHKILLEATIPVELVIGSARTGFGCLSEWEFVVMDHDGYANIRRI